MRYFLGFLSQNLVLKMAPVAVASLSLNISCSHDDTTLVSQPEGTVSVSATALADSFFKMTAAKRKAFFAGAAATTANMWQRSVLADLGQRSLSIDGIAVDLKQSLAVYNEVNVPMGVLWQAVGLDPEALVYNDGMNALKDWAASGQQLNLVESASLLPQSTKNDINNWLQAGAPACSPKQTITGARSAQISNPTAPIPAPRTLSTGTTYTWDKGHFNVSYGPRGVTVQTMYTGYASSSFTQPVLRCGIPFFGGELEGAVKDYTTEQITTLRNRDVVNLITSYYLHGTDESAAQEPE